MGRIRALALLLVLLLIPGCVRATFSAGSDADAAVAPETSEAPACSPAPQENSRWCGIEGRIALPLLEAPREDADKLGNIFAGERVEILEPGEIYSKVYSPTGQQEGYMQNGYFVAADDYIPAEIEKTDFQNALMRVIGDEPVPMRTAPDWDAEIIGELEPEREVKLKGYLNAFAHVETEGITGYVPAGYLLEETPFYDDTDRIVKATDVYTYEQLTADLAALKEKYPQVRLTTLGKSSWGTDIPMFIIGNEQAPHQIIIQAAMHAREHMTALLVMALAEDALMQDQFPADGEFCLHIVPMINPDGVLIAQSDEMPENIREIYELDLQEGKADGDPVKYLSRWKANGAGVDLNRNFDAGYKTDALPTRPASERYPGDVPEDQPESRALAEYTRQINPCFTLSYHSTGSVIYWNYGEYAANARCWDLGLWLAEWTGYQMVGSTSVDGSGYKDWCVTVGIPGLTIETGTCECPLQVNEFGSIWVRHQNSWKLLCENWIRK